MRIAILHSRFNFVCRLKLFATVQIYKLPFFHFKELHALSIMITLWRNSVSIN